MSHSTPRIIQVSAERARAVFAHFESRRNLSHGEVDDALFVNNRSDRVRISFLAESNSTAVRMERQLIRVEVSLVQ